MDHKDSLEGNRQEILRQMSAITRMRRGTVNEQYFEVPQKDGSVVRRGPYFLYSRTEKGKSFSQRVALDEADRYREETDNCRRFKELSSRCVMICEELAEANEESWGKNGRSTNGTGERNSPVYGPGREGVYPQWRGRYGGFGTGNAGSRPERWSRSPGGIATEHCRSRTGAFSPVRTA